MGHTRFRLHENFIGTSIPSHFGPRWKLSTWNQAFENPNNVSYSNVQGLKTCDLKLDFRAFEAQSTKDTHPPTRSLYSMLLLQIFLITNTNHSDIRYPKTIASIRRPEEQDLKAEEASGNDACSLVIKSFQNNCSPDPLLVSQITLIHIPPHRLFLSAITKEAILRPVNKQTFWQTTTRA